MNIVPFRATTVVGRRDTTSMIAVCIGENKPATMVTGKSIAVQGEERAEESGFAIYRYIR